MDARIAKPGVYGRIGKPGLKQLNVIMFEWVQGFGSVVY